MTMNRSDMTSVNNNPRKIERVSEESELVDQIVADSYSTTEIAVLLHIKTGTVLNRINKKSPMPPKLKVGTKWLFPKTDFEIWIKTQTQFQNGMKNES